MKEYSDYQKKIIKRFYDNRGDIDFRRLGEIASDLYLSTGKKTERLWKQAGLDDKCWERTPTRQESPML